jgi:hypothetical protein
LRLPATWQAFTVSMIEFYPLIFAPNQHKELQIGDNIIRQFNFACLFMTGYNGTTFLRVFS